MKYTYQEIKDGEIVISILKTDETGKAWSIPIDPANSDYQAYLNKDEQQAAMPKQEWVEPQLTK